MSTPAFHVKMRNEKHASRYHSGQEELETSNNKSFKTQKAKENPDSAYSLEFFSWKSLKPRSQLWGKSSSYMEIICKGLW